MPVDVTSKLFTPVKVGALNLAHRVVMAPMSRMRSNEDDSVSDMMVDHYAQRASKGALIIMEGSVAAANGRAYKGAPGLYDDRFIPGFSRIAHAVHAKGGLIFAQLYHGGRVSHTSLQPDGGSPVAPSAGPFSGHAATEEGEVVASPARELTIDEIRAVIEEFRKAALRAKVAGFDGVELHSANGYLLDQFLEDSSNKRNDIYGGSIENRARFVLEVTNAAISVFGPGRVAVRISPSGEFNEMSETDPEALFGYLAQQLDKFPLAFLHIIEPRIYGNDDKVTATAIPPVAAAILRKHYKGTIMVAGGFLRDSAEAILQSGDADVVAFGRYYTSNPDLPERLRRNLPLTKYQRQYFYGKTPLGYNDYSVHEELVSAGETNKTR